MTRPGAVVWLLRLPAGLSVPGDALAGAAAAGWPGGAPRACALPLASACLYWSGMALNDYADRDVDALERPERPIPSGEVTAAQALAIAAGLTAAGLAVAAAAGGRESLAVAVPLAGVVWAYDLVLGATPAGPAVMAAARGMDVLLGAGASGAGAALPAALAVAGHVLTTTVLSRAEVSGAGSAAAPAVALLGSACAGAAALLAPDGRSSRLAAVCCTALFAATVGPAQLAALRERSPAAVRRAVGASILGLIPLQSSLLAGRRALPAAVAVAGALPLARRLTRRVSAT